MYRSKKKRVIRRSGFSAVLASCAIASGVGIASIAGASTHPVAPIAASIAPHLRQPSTQVLVSHVGSTNPGAAVPLARSGG